MPFTVNTRTESKSIEDLIAQLDAPTKLAEQASTNDHDQSNLNDRKIIRGKRTNSSSSGNGGQNNNNATGGGGDPVLNKNIIISKKYTKSFKGRGAAKKGGSGGKGTWGAPGCELNSFESLDHNDPNYDSEDAGNVVMVCVENNNVATDEALSDFDREKQKSLQTLEIDDLESEIKLVILEYFQNGDAVEVIDHLKCYNFQKMKSKLLAYVIQLALEQNNTCKELVSRLLRDFHHELFKSTDFELAFGILANNINDLILDNPDASKTIGTFIARSIADKILTKEFLVNNNFNLNDVKVKEVIEQAKLLVNMNDHLFHLSHIWGHKNGGFTAVQDLTDKVNYLIQEYYDSGDVDEAIRCLKDLNVPHFNHEFVYEALDFALQKGDDHVIQLVVNLFKKLSDSVIVTYDQFKLGFTRIYDVLPDICLDVPNAYSYVEKIINECNLKGFIGNDIIDLAPNRSRKRFVSEGDGGKFKDEVAH